MAIRGLRIVNQFRAQHRLAPYTSLDQLSSQRAHICQIPEAFDFPRQSSVSPLHCVGPFDDFSARPTCAFPFEWLDGRPLVYVSFGTLQNRLAARFKDIAELCERMPIQAVLSLGGGGKPDDYGELPSNVKMVRYAPQTELLKRASLCVTHAGMNTTLECLALGVPMVSIPVANDQPAVAARIVYHGVGQRITLRQLASRTGIARLAQSIDEVLERPTYRKNVERFSKDIQAKPGGRSAADEIERVLNADDEPRQ